MVTVPPSLYFLKTVVHFKNALQKPQIYFLQKLVLGSITALNCYDEYLIIITKCVAALKSQKVLNILEQSVHTTVSPLLSMPMILNLHFSQMPGCLAIQSYLPSPTTTKSAMCR